MTKTPVVFRDPPLWAEDAFDVGERHLEKTWHIEFDPQGPQWVLSNGYTCLVLASDGSAPFTVVVKETEDTGALTPSRMTRLGRGYRDYPAKCHWGELSILALRDWCNPDRWSKVRPGEQYEARLLAFIHADKRRVVFDRDLVWYMFKELAAETVRIEFDGAEDPIHFTAPGWRLIVMPTVPRGIDLKRTWTWRAKAGVPTVAARKAA